MGRSVALVGGLLVGALLALAACADPEPEPTAPAPVAASPSPAATEVAAPSEPRSGGILKRTHPTDPAGFDPVQDSSINTVFLIAPVYSQLLRFDPQGGEALTP